MKTPRYKAQKSRDGWAVLDTKRVRFVRFMKDEASAKENAAALNLTLA